MVWILIIPEVCRAIVTELWFVYHVGVIVYDHNYFDIVSCIMNEGSEEMGELENNRHTANKILNV